MNSRIQERRLSLIGTCCLLVLFLWCSALRASQQEPAKGLVINILEGEGALNDVRAGTAREPIVQVEDENNRPVAGAVVLFTLPDSGPGGLFTDGTHVFSTTTDYAGRAMAGNFAPNNVSGSYEIHVTANFNGMSAQTTIHQENISPGEQSAKQHAAHALSLKSILIIVGAVAAGGAAAALIATSGGGSSPTTISPGTPVVGAPSSTTGIRFQLHRPR
jgi:hypothetical protein